MWLADLQVRVHPAGGVLTLHSHPDPHLVVVLSGEFIDVSAGVGRRCVSSTLLVRAAGEPHEDHFRSASAYVSISLPATVDATMATKDAAMTRTFRRIAESALTARACALIDARCASHLRIGGIAAELGVDAVRLSRSVRRACGRTPSQLRTEARLRRACDELRQSHRSIAEIALRCGFYDQSHMTNVFRRLLGVTPKSIRENFSKT